MKSEFNLVEPCLEFSVFFDQGQLVVLAHGFQKKTQKTPKKEIEMAHKIKAEYESEK
jgi:phage-related protein